MKNILTLISRVCVIAALLCTISWAVWTLGFLPNGRVEVDKSAYWPDLKVGTCAVRWWKNGDIVYHEDFDWHLSDNYDSLLKVHLQSLDAFIKIYK